MVMIRRDGGGHGPGSFWSTLAHIAHKYSRHIARCPSPEVTSHRGATISFNKVCLSYLFLLNTLDHEDEPSTGIVAKPSQEKKRRHLVQDSSLVAFIARFN